MLFCPHCRHQLSHTWAGTVCFSCGACYRGEAESSIASLRAYTPAGLAYLALLKASAAYQPSVRAALAVHATMDEFLMVETHFPRLIWNAQPEVRRSYAALVSATRSAPVLPTLHENAYPSTRFLEQARVHLKQLFFGESAAAELFNPLEGERAVDYSLAYEQLNGLVDTNGFGAPLALGLCNACGLLAQVGRYTPLERQVSTHCLDCRGGRLPYTYVLREMGAFRESRAQSPSTVPPEVHVGPPREGSH